MASDNQDLYFLNKLDPGKLVSPFAEGPNQLTTKYDIYVTRKHPEVVYVKRALKLLRSPNTKGLCIRGLGASVNSAAVVAVAIQQEWRAPLSISVSTSTVELTDEFLPLTASSKPLPPSQRRNSAITIIIRPLHHPASTATSSSSS